MTEELEEKPKKLKKKPPPYLDPRQQEHIEFNKKCREYERQQQRDAWAHQPSWMVPTGAVR